MIFFILSVILIFTPAARGSVRIWAWGPALIAEYALVLVWILRTVKGQSPRPRRQNDVSGTVPTTTVPSGAVPFIILAAVSFVFASYKHESFFALLRLSGYIGIYYVIVGSFGHRMVKNLMYLVVCIGTGLSAYGLLQYFGFLDHSWWVPKEFLAATYVNHNHFAGYLEMAIPVTIGALIRTTSHGIDHRPQSTVNRLVLISALVIMGTAFVFTQSRGAWICLTASLFAMGIALIKNKTIKVRSVFVLLWVVMVIVLIAYANGSAVSKRMDTIGAVTAGEVTGDLRLKMWEGSLKMILANPLIGTGIGTFDGSFNRYRPLALNSIRAEFAHNDYLNMASEMGILAPFLMLWIFFSIVRKGFMKGRHPVAAGCAAGVLSLSLHALVDFNFHIPANMILFTVLAGCVVAECKKG